MSWKARAAKLHYDLMFSSWYIHVLIWGSLVSLGIGIFAPILTFKKMIVLKNTFSISSGLVSLFEEGEYLLFMLIFVFSIVFPVCKILLLVVIWLFSSLPRDRVLKYLGFLGRISRWSMLDVFIVAILVVTVRLGVIGKVEAQWGIYVFAASVILSTHACSRVISVVRLNWQG
jgi:paraquat-inducible protein A